jgi:hypothetical protein
VALNGVIKTERRREKERETERERGVLGIYLESEKEERGSCTRLTASENSQSPVVVLH